jgi:hypothetical protein
VTCVTGRLSWRASPARISLHRLTVLSNFRGPHPQLKQWTPTERIAAWRAHGHPPAPPRAGLNQNSSSYFFRPVPAIIALTEGCSIRSVEGLIGVHRDTIMRLGAVALGKSGEGCAQADHDHRWNRDFSHRYPPESTRGTSSVVLVCFSARPDSDTAAPKCASRSGFEVRSPEREKATPAPG